MDQISLEIEIFLKKSYKTCFSLSSHKEKPHITSQLVIQSSLSELD